MGWGIWKKIKEGFKKVGRGIKKAATKVYNVGKKVVKGAVNVVKKINFAAKPVKGLIKTAGTFLGNAIAPGAGNVVGGVIDKII